MVMRQGSADSQTRITDVPIHGGKRTLSDRFHRDIIRIHKEHEALRTGSLMFLKGDDNLRRDDNLRGDDNLLCYARFNRREQFVVLVNNKEQERECGT